MTSFALKIIAIISMLCDHLGYSCIGHFSFLNLIGRIAFPIFAFQISEGFIHTSNLKKYTLRLFIFAIISQVPFYLYYYKFIDSSPNTLNIFFTLLLGLICMIVYNYFSKLNNSKLNIKLFNLLEIKKIIGICFSLIIAYLGNLINVDYGFWGIIIIFSFYLFKENKIAMIISYICLCIIKYCYLIMVKGFYIEYIYLAICASLAILFIAAYNGKQGPKIKYFMYLFYPVHLALIYFLI